MRRKQRAADRLAKLLNEIFYEQFDGVASGMFTITWNELRELVGGVKIDPILIRFVQRQMSKHDLVLVPLDDSLLIAEPSELTARRVPGRVVNEYLGWEPDEDEDEEIDSEWDEAGDEVEA